jgi:hypothetical protein
MCKLYAMHHSKRILAPTGLVYKVVMTSLYWVALLDSLHNKIVKDFRLTDKLLK